MCLPFGALFHEICYSDRGVFIRDWVYFGQIIVESAQFIQNWFKIGCFSFENGIGLLIGGKLGKTLVFKESQIFEARQAHSRTILVKVTSRGFL